MEGVSTDGVTAATVFDMKMRKLEKTLFETPSGRELRKQGFKVDVQMAAELNVSEAVPVLVDGIYISGKL